jgi:hypothetical protein
MATDLKQSPPAHTPGPWIITNAIEVRPQRRQTQVVALIHEAIGAENNRLYAETREANGRLIAAAPELLEALKYLVDKCPDDMNADYNPHAGPLAKACAAIATWGFESPPPHHNLRRFPRIAVRSTGQVFGQVSQDGRQTRPIFSVAPPLRGLFLRMTFRRSQPSP